MAGTDCNMKRCCTSSRLLRPCSVHRLNSLPDDLLSQILSLLQTKDAAATQVLSKRMRRAFTWITNVNLDDSPVSHSLEPRNFVDRFPLFKSFVTNVFQKLLRSEAEQPLTRFRLCLGGDKTTNPWHYHNKRACFPYLEPVRLNVWICNPLTMCGLREVDLSFHVGNPNECKLPPRLFTCESLEMLKLDSNIEIEDGADIPIICLPNLKLLRLHSFVPRLVSSCPALVDLSVTHCYWKKSDGLTILSHSLQKLVLIKEKMR